MKKVIHEYNQGRLIVEGGESLIEIEYKKNEYSDELFIRIFND